MFLVAWKLPETKGKGNLDGHETNYPKQGFQRVDFLGAGFMSATILSLSFILDMGGVKFAWLSPVILILGCVAVVCAVGFYLVERSWAKEPIFPLHLLSCYDVVTSYTLILLQNASQTAVSYLDSTE